MAFLLGLIFGLSRTARRVVYLAVGVGLALTVARYGATAHQRQVGVELGYGLAAWYAARFAWAYLRR